MAFTWHIHFQISKLLYIPLHIPLHNKYIVFHVIPSPVNVATTVMTSTFLYNGLCVPSWQNNQSIHMLTCINIFPDTKTNTRPPAIDYYVYNIRMTVELEHLYDYLWIHLNQTNAPLIKVPLIQWFELQYTSFRFMFIWLWCVWIDIHERNQYRSKR